MVAVAFMPRITDPGRIPRRGATPDGCGIAQRPHQSSLRDENRVPVPVTGR
jgi:hypothetical protein